MGKVLFKGRTAKRANAIGLWRHIWYNRYLYLMLIPAVIYYLLIHYVPMYGATIAFKDFYITKGILKSPWVGFKHFEYVFSLDKFTHVFLNTIIINTYRLVFGFPAPIIVSLLLNEVRHRWYKRSIQTLIYLPHFISWVILSGLLINILSIEGGVINELIKLLGGTPIGFLTDESYFRGTLVISNIWKEYGWSTIIYMAALASINQELYDAAIVDGANRWQQTIYITLPSISSTIIVLLILRLGRLMETGFEQVFVMLNPAVYRVADIIDTYAYRIGLSEGRYSLASAVGLFKSVVNFSLLFITNIITKKLFNKGIF